jgi:uncharacterized protein
MLFDLFLILFLCAATNVWGLSGDNVGRSNPAFQPFNSDGSNVGAVVWMGDVDDEQKDFRRCSSSRRWMNHQRQDEEIGMLCRDHDRSTRRSTTAKAVGGLKTGDNMEKTMLLASRTTSMWPPWPLSLLQRKKEADASSTLASSSPSPSIDKDATEGSGSTYQYPSMALLMFSYLRQRTRIWVRQLEEIGSQVWFNLPPATPPLILLASIPRKIVTEDPRTGEEITRRVFPVFSNPLARSMIAFGLGMAVLSWSQQELKRKRKLTPLPLAIRYESVSRVFLPPFLPEDVPEPELEALDKVVAASNASGDKLFEEEDEGNNMLSKVSPKIRKHLNDLYETASNPQKNIQYYLEEWKRGRLARKREAAKIRRLRVFDELVALQALKRKAAKSRNAQSSSSKDPETGFALVTGASEGIGRAIAVELARWEIPLVLVARNVDKLMSLAYDLEACYGVKCCVLGADLSQIDAAEKIHEVTTKAGITIDILVNNAGIAFEGLTVDMTPSDVERMVVLNAVTYAKLSQLYGQDMKRRRRGRMLMVSSMAGLCNAAPNTAVYGATKAFGKSLSLSMSKEMEPYGVGVTCLLPGAVGGTQFRARSGTQRALCWSMPFYPRSPEAVAHQGIVSVLDGDSQTIPGWQNRVFATIIRPIIPQRFEIMTVQAAFSPLRLPNFKDLFRRDMPDGMQEEECENHSSQSRSEIIEEGTSWIPLLEPRYKTQPLPRILKLPEPEVKMHVEEKEATNEQQEPNVNESEKEIDSITMDNPAARTNETIIENSEERTGETASGICEPETPTLATNESTVQKEQETSSKQKVVTTVDLEDDVVVIVEKETERTPPVPKNDLQSKDNSGDSEKVDPLNDEKTRNDKGNGKVVSKPPKFWNDADDSPFSHQFWSDEADAPFSSRLFSGEALMESLHLKRQLFAEIVSLLANFTAIEIDFLSSETANLRSPRTATALTPKKKRREMPLITLRLFHKFILPNVFLVSLSLGSSFRASTALLFNTKSVMTQRRALKLYPLTSAVTSLNYRSNASNLSASSTLSDDGSSPRLTAADRPHNVKFVAPLLDYGYPPAVNDLLNQHNQTSDASNGEDAQGKPILLYLPGFDGTYICPFLQFPELGTEFEVWAMTVGMNDRSTYQEIKAMVLDFIKNDLSSGNRDVDSAMPSETVGEDSPNKTSESKKSGGGSFLGMFGGSPAASIGKRQNAGRRPIYLVGESFGGILASDVALTLLTEKRNSVNYNGQQTVNLQGLVLINPATCYDRSQLAIKGPQVSRMPKALYLMGLLGQLLPLFTDEYSVEQLGLILQAKALPSVIDTPQREAYMGRVAISLPTKLEFMPPDTLEWRLEEWLQTGCAKMRESTFKQFPKFRTLVVVGENDKTLPSIAEAERLTNRVLLPSQTLVHVVEGAGHASTCGSRLDLAAIMRNHFSELQMPKKKQVVMKAEAEMENMGNEKRTSMKPTAREGTGAFFGMEERYDKAKIGLNPILYWSRNNYRSVKSKIEERVILVPNSTQEVSYKKAAYKVSA